MSSADTDEQQHTFFRKDSHRLIRCAGSAAQTLDYCVSEWERLAREAIEKRGRFSVALSGGSTPKTIFQRLASRSDRSGIDWSRVYIFWGDERSVAADSADSNFRMAMVDAGLGSIAGLNKDNVFRMEAEPAPSSASDATADDVQAAHARARGYEATILRVLGSPVLDLVMLGVGEDGHTASLFPGTAALQPSDPTALVLYNHVPQLNTWRMTLSYTCINQARRCLLYVLGKAKAPILEKLFGDEISLVHYPSQGVGTPENNAVWIIDADALPASFSSLQVHKI